MARAGDVAEASQQMVLTHKTCDGCQYRHRSALGHPQVTRPILRVGEGVLTYTSGGCTLELQTFLVDAAGLDCVWDAWDACATLWGGLGTSRVLRCGIRVDSLDSQLAVSFRLVSSCSVLHHPCGTLSHHQRLWVQLCRSSVLLAPDLDDTHSFQECARFRRSEGNP